MYRERPSAMAGAVAWTHATTDDEVTIHPDGCMDIIWSNDGTLFVAGPDTHASTFQGDAGQRLTGIRFPPGVAPAVLGVPAVELRNQRVPLDAVWALPATRLLRDRLAEASTPAHILDAAAIEQLRLRGAPDARAVETARLLGQGWQVDRVADHVGLSERQLLRRSLEWFGYGPKTLARILRLQQALTLARSGSPFVVSAFDAGYSDQAHLARDVRALTGSSLTRLLRAPLAEATG